MSATKEIALMLGIPDAGVVWFCRQVQRCYQGPAPKLSAIVANLERDPNASPEQIAEMVRVTQPATHPVRKKPHGIDTTQKRSRRSRKRTRRAHVHFMVCGFRDPHELGKCPHGVPVGPPCALCDPGGFKRQTGM